MAGNHARSACGMHLKTRHSPQLFDSKRELSPKNDLWKVIVGKGFWVVKLNLL